ncbi:MAG TPA: prolipoprotein diacylglyceryl transferase [Chryseolinea sp.]|nr:prolipoprotein diacylglyceryl transferase [Chryseolinea sp.]
MHPILFELSGIKVYSYGFFIALGAIGGVADMAIRGKKDVGLTFDQANLLFLVIFFSAFVGGKVFLFFEDISYYSNNPGRLIAGRGFVFYGSFLFAVPSMLIFFRKNKLPTYAMLDVMAVTTCIVHMFGRIGCFMAGCCYGKPTDSFTGVVFTDPACQADPLNTSLHPSQLYEAFYILVVLLVVLYLRERKRFYGQLFLVYLVLYAIGRFVLEYVRGDLARGLLLDGLISHSQLIATAIFVVVIFTYVSWSSRNQVDNFKGPI